MGKLRVPNFASDAGKQRIMNKRGWMVLSASLLLLSGAVLYTYQRYHARGPSVRGDVLAMMPSDASAVVFVDLAELRAAPFVAQLYAWAPQPQPDEDYAQFLTETGFHYERDLDHLAMAFEKNGQDSTFLAVPEGNFDPQRIFPLATKFGGVEKDVGGERFALQ